MNLTNIMTPEEQRIAIAEFCGWTKIRANKSTGYLLGIKPRGCLASVPDYLTSRDAICGAVARLDDDRFSSFVVNLEKTCGCREWWESMDEDDMRRIILATPSQLADALLLTLGHKI